MSSMRRFVLGLLASLALAIAGLTSPIIPGAVTSAAAQVSADFQAALESYGHWQRSARWGEVWVPDQLPPDWRPYTYGHWVYTDEWGWYWISDPEEQDWGWVAFHYGRWARDRALGWFWIPDDEWGPAWVDWRYGGDYVGWAALPPDDVIVEYDDDPAYWVFVSPRYLTSPRWRSYGVASSRRAAAFRQTAVVNRTLGYGRGRAAVNAGVSPAFVARASRSPLRTFRVSPRVVASTQGVSGAVRVTPDQLRASRSEGGQRGGRRPATSNVTAVAVQPTSVTIKATAAVTAPQPLPKGERGRLGTHPPRAAQGAPSPQPLQQQPQSTPQTQQPPAQRQPPPQQQQRPQPAPPPAAAPPAASPPPAQPQRAAPAAPPPATPPPAQPQRAAPPPPAAPPPAQPQRAAPPPQTPPPPRHEPERPRPPPPAAPPAARPATPPQPPAAPHPPPPPHPAPPPAARPASPPPPPAAKPPPPPPAAKPPPPAAKPAPPPAKPEEKKEPPK